MYMQNNRVFVTKIINDNLFESMNRLIDLLNFPEQANSVGIKLNLCDYRKYETGVTSDPRVLEQLLKILRTKYSNARIYLFENDATGSLAENLYPYLGLDTIARKYDADCINLRDCNWITKKIDGYHFKEIEIPKLLEDTDLIINHPKLKTHGRTKVTCGLKNMFGCHRTKEKGHFHKFLSNAIVDINIPLKSHFTIVDGYISLEGNRGPTQGYPKKTSLFIGGTDVVAVDAFAAKLMGFKPFFIEHIRKSHYKKIGNMNYQLSGDLRETDLHDYRFKFSTGKFWLMQSLRKVLK